MPGGDITLILQRVERGEESSAERLLPLVYEELRKLAAARMAREAPGGTLQATALVHEAWLRLGGAGQPRWQNRAHFFSAAAEAMRRILIESARRRKAARHGGGLERVDVQAPGFELPVPEQDEQLLQVHEALDRLAEHEHRKAEIVKMKHFAGMEFQEIAEVLGISIRTVERDWMYARAWLFREITAERT